MPTPANNWLWNSAQGADLWFSGQLWWHRPLAWLLPGLQPFPGDRVWEHLALKNCRIQDQNWQAAQIHKSSFWKVRFQRCDLSETSLRYSGARHSEFSEVNFNSSNCQGLDLYHSQLSSVTGSQSDFKTASVTQTQIWHSDFSSSNWRLSQWWHTDVRHCDFTGADFREITATRVNFLNTDFYQADFSGASVYRCGFQGCQLTGVKVNSDTFFDCCDLDPDVRFWLILQGARVV